MGEAVAEVIDSDEGFETGTRDQGDVLSRATVEDGCWIAGPGLKELD